MGDPEGMEEVVRTFDYVLEEDIRHEGEVVLAQRSGSEEEDWQVEPVEEVVVEDRELDYEDCIDRKMVDQGYWWLVERSEREFAGVAVGAAGAAVVVGAVAIAAAAVLEGHYDWEWRLRMRWIEIIDCLEKKREQC